MKQFFTLCIFATIAALVYAAPVSAETVLRTGEKVSLSDDQTVEGDFYAAAGPISLSGTIVGDAHLVGGSITTNGEIESDLFAVGGTVQVHASVTDDVRIVAGEVTLAEYVGGDVFVLGGVLTILSTAEIAGDVFFYGGEGEVNGVVRGSLYGASEKMRIDGPVGGNVDVRTAKLEIGDRADIGGDLQYESQRELIRAQNAVVVGDIIRNDSVHGGAPSTRDALIPILIYAFSALILLAVFRTKLQKLLTRTVNQFTMNGLIGVGASIFLPVAIMLTVATIIGSIIGLVAFLLTLAFWFISFLLSGVLMGLLLNQYIKKRNEVTLLSTLAGIAVLSVVVLIPVVGPVVLLVLTVAIFGTFLRMLYEYIV